MTWTMIATISGIITAVFFGIWLAVRSIANRAKKQGKMEKELEGKDSVLYTIDKAKRVDEATSASGDPNWVNGVRNKYRRS
jgi:cbb3-type cytochrome oxidase subunit 3